jgi:hypothetical protein
MSVTRLSCIARYAAVGAGRRDVASSGCDDEAETQNAEALRGASRKEGEARGSEAHVPRV